MPDFEIRYFHADNSLALVRMTVAPDERRAIERARAHQEPYARFEVRRAGSAPLHTTPE